MTVLSFGQNGLTTLGYLIFGSPNGFQRLWDSSIFRKIQALPLQKALLFKVTSIKLPKKWQAAQLTFFGSQNISALNFKTSSLIISEHSSHPFFISAGKKSIKFLTSFRQLSILLLDDWAQSIIAGKYTADFHLYSQLCSLICFLVFHGITSGFWKQLVSSQTGQEASTEAQVFKNRHEVQYSGVFPVCVLTRELR